MPHNRSYGVYGRATQEELSALELADRLRQAIHAEHLAEHRATIDFRNERFPELWDALCEKEHVSALIYAAEREIKAVHSDVRDRNYVSEDQEEALVELRLRRKRAQTRAKEARRPWSRFLSAFSAAWSAAANWKDVKDLAKRKEMYASLQIGPALCEAKRRSEAAIAEAKNEDERTKAQNRYDRIGWESSMELLIEFGKIRMRHDLARRELLHAAQADGMHSGTKGEIAEATAPKTGKDGPGTRYSYHDSRPPSKWRKLVVQFAGGLRVEDAIAGEDKRLSLRRDSKWPNVLCVRQQIGTADRPRFAEYRVKLHRPLSPEMVMQRWALVIEEVHGASEIVRQKTGVKTRRSVIVTVSKDIPSKAHGTEVLNVWLGWSLGRDGTCRVAQLRSKHVSEDVILPAWLMRRRVRVSSVEAKCDQEANELLLERHVILGELKLKGVCALEQWSKDTGEEIPELRDLLVRPRRARMVESWAVETIRHVYRTVAARMGRLHGSVRFFRFDLKQMVRYDTRDLLAQNAAPDIVRRVRFAVAPGKLKAALLEALPEEDASDEVMARPPAIARSTDVFTSWVNSLGSAGGKESSYGTAARESARKSLRRQPAQSRR